MSMRFSTGDEAFSSPVSLDLLETEGNDSLDHEVRNIANNDNDRSSDCLTNDGQCSIDADDQKMYINSKTAGRDHKTEETDHIIEMNHVTETSHMTERVHTTESGHMYQKNHTIERGHMSQRDHTIERGHMSQRDHTIERNYMTQIDHMTGNKTVYEEVEEIVGKQIKNPEAEKCRMHQLFSFVRHQFYLLLSFFVLTIILATFFSISIYLIITKERDMTEIQSFQFRILDEVKNLEHAMMSLDNITRYSQVQHNNLKSNFELLKGKNLPRDCNDILSRNKNSSSKVYRVYLSYGNATNVFCDMKTPGGPWLVFQRRKDNSTDFYRNWMNYTYGFGDLNGDFWLGNENLYLLTSGAGYKLRIDLEDWDGEKRYAEYESFVIGDGSDFYRLSVSGYALNHNGTAEDSLESAHSGQQFSTYDEDHDSYGNSKSCATLYRGGWWYNACHRSNLNGVYLRGPYATPERAGIEWYGWHGPSYSLKTTEMKISRIDRH